MHALTLGLTDKQPCIGPACWKLHGCACMTVPTCMGPCHGTNSSRTQSSVHACMVLYIFVMFYCTSASYRPHGMQACMHDLAAYMHVAPLCREQEELKRHLVTHDDVDWYIPGESHDAAQHEVSMHDEPLGLPTVHCRSVCSCCACLLQLVALSNYGICLQKNACT